MNTIASVCLASALASQLTAQQFLMEQPAMLVPPSLGLASFQGSVFADYDGDGDADLVLASLFQLRLLRNDGTGDFTDTSSGLPPSAAGATGLLGVDVDGDGRDELLLSSYQGHRLFGYTPAGVWQDRSAALPQLGYPLVFAAGDFDLDGDVDLVGAATLLGGGTNVLYTNQGGGTFTVSQPFVGAGNWLFPGDFDGDGDLDVLFGGPVQLLRNDGNMIFTDVSVQLPFSGNISSCGVGDVDGDGDLDLLVADFATASTALLRNIGGGSFVVSAGAIAPLAGATRGLQLLDVDEDGDLDVLRSSAMGEVVLSRNDGSGNFSAAVAGVAGLTGSVGLSVGDLDGDGDGDAIAWPSASVGHLLRNLHRQVVLPQPPQLGQSWSMQLWSEPGYAGAPRAAWLAVGVNRLAQPFDLVPFGALWLDLGSPHAVAALWLQPGVVPTVHALAIPNLPGLQGVELFVQALVESGSGLGELRFTSLVKSQIQ